MITTKPIRLHHVEIRNNNRHRGMYGINIKDKPSVMAFTNIDDAYTCLNFISHYQNVYKTLPSMELHTIVGRPKLDIYKKDCELDIITTEYDLFANTCQMYSINALGVCTYNCEIENHQININFQAFQIWDNEYCEHNINLKKITFEVLYSLETYTEE